MYVCTMYVIHVYADSGTKRRSKLSGVIGLFEREWEEGSWKWRQEEREGDVEDDREGGINW